MHFTFRDGQLVIPHTVYCRYHARRLGACDSLQIESSI